MRSLRRAILETASAAVLCAVLPVVAGRADDAIPQHEARIATISGVHDPHQGFALSATVASDRLCLELAQNLASELGIAVHVVCTAAASGRSTIVAECGYAHSRKATKVGSYSPGWVDGDGSFLLCVPPQSNRFPAQRIAPDLEALRPAAQPWSECPPHGCVEPSG